MSRFVVLTHDHPFLHWDFMFEQGTELRTWRLLAEPLFESGEPIAAESLADHRLEYLDYEGPVSNNRGEVRRWDSGTFDLVDERENCVEMRLSGEQLQGLAVLECEPDSNDWRFYFRSD